MDRGRPQSLAEGRWETGNELGRHFTQAIVLGGSSVPTGVALSSLVCVADLVAALVVPATSSHRIVYSDHRTLRESQPKGTPGVVGE